MIRGDSFVKIRLVNQEQSVKLHAKFRKTICTLQSVSFIFVLLCCYLFGICIFLGKNIDTINVVSRFVYELVKRQTPYESMSNSSFYRTLLRLRVMTVC